MPRRAPRPSNAVGLRRPRSGRHHRQSEKVGRTRTRPGSSGGFLRQTSSRRRPHRYGVQGSTTEGLTSNLVFHDRARRNDICRKASRSRPPPRVITASHQIPTFGGRHLADVRAGPRIAGVNPSSPLRDLQRLLRSGRSAFRRASRSSIYARGRATRDGGRAYAAAGARLRFCPGRPDRGSLSGKPIILTSVEGRCLDE